MVNCFLLPEMLVPVLVGFSLAFVTAIGAFSHSFKLQHLAFALIFIAGDVQVLCLLCVQLILLQKIAVTPRVSIISGFIS